VGKARADLSEVAGAYSGRLQSEGNLRAITNLAAVILPPAETFVSGSYAARMAEAGAHLPEQVRARDGHRQQALGGRAIAELADAIGSPAVATPVRIAHATGMAGARFHLVTHAAGRYSG